jgi:hypothetical protein
LSSLAGEIDENPEKMVLPQAVTMAGAQFAPLHYFPGS